MSSSKKITKQFVGMELAALGQLLIHWAIGWKAFYILLLISFTPIIFVGLPFLLISKLTRKPPEG